MDFNEYQKEARKTAIYPVVGEKFVYPVIGLAGEAGEVCDKVKKVLRDKKELSEEVIWEIGKELGDVLWYLSQACSELGIDLDEVAKRNVEKINSRMQRDKIHGSGDNR